MNLQNCKFSFLNLICSVLECKQNDKVFDLSKKHYELSIFVIVVRYLQIKINLIPFIIMETGVWYS